VSTVNQRPVTEAPGEPRADRGEKIRCRSGLSACLSSRIQFRGCGHYPVVVSPTHRLTSHLEETFFSVILIQIPSHAKRCGESRGPSSRHSPRHFTITYIHGPILLPATLSLPGRPYTLSPLLLLLLFLSTSFCGFSTHFPIYLQLNLNQKGHYGPPIIWHGHFPAGMVCSMNPLSIWNTRLTVIALCCQG
jgi:hypothetical protein